jgi:DNA-binding XRE family transcriptional regulator
MISTLLMTVLLDRSVFDSGGQAGRVPTFPGRRFPYGRKGNSAKGRTFLDRACHFTSSRYSGQKKDSTEAKFLLQEEFLDSAAVTKAFGRVLREQRKQARLTQEQLALTADLQRNYVSELERGEKQASVVTLFKLTTALRVAPHEFVRLLSGELGCLSAGEEIRPRF